MITRIICQIRRAGLLGPKLNIRVPVGAAEVSELPGRALNDCDPIQGIRLGSEVGSLALCTEH
jgi:hypothetical protein